MLRVAGAAWAALVLASFFELWLFDRLWVLAWLPLGMLWVTAVVTTLVVVARAPRARWPVAVAGAALAVAVAVTDWPMAFAHGWFALHRGAFDRTAALADSGALGPPSSWPYYGAELPGGLRALSVTGEVAGVGAVGDRTVLFLPAYVGIPDGAVGFVRIPPGPPPEVMDGFGDPLRVVVALGGDWYWAA